MPDEKPCSHDELEEQLYRRMRRVPAPAGLAAVVLQEAARQQADSPQLQSTAPSSRANSQLSSLPRVSRLGSRQAAGLAAGLLLIVLPTGGYLHWQREQARARDTARQFALAMRLTQAALLDAGTRLAHPPAR